MAIVAGFALLVGCAAKGADEAGRNQRSASTTAADATSPSTPAGSGEPVKFGTLASPCGHGDAKVSAADAGKGTDKLYIGVANDRGSTIVPGLLKELWDGSTAFVKWCNEQGGINGLPLEAVDLDGKVLNVADAMATACTGVFAIVGGGWAQDQNMFTGKEGSDFHKCGLIAFPGFAVSTDFSEASDQVQAQPNPAHDKVSAGFEALAKLYPKEAKKFGTVYGELDALKQNNQQIIGVAKETKGFAGFEEISYKYIGNDWAVTAKQVIDSGMKMISFVGEPANMSKFSQALKDQNWEGVISADGNQYDQRLIEQSGPAAVEGVAIRQTWLMFEDAARKPAMKQLVGILDKEVPDWTHAGLAIQAFSASLLFATAAKACADEGEITRKCVLQKGLDTHKWDGGGLHGTTDPGRNESSTCQMLSTVRNGKFVRLFPKLGSKDDAGNGLYCNKALVHLEGDYGQGNKTSSILG
ncbi:MAG: ABC transporter substrate-binding protein [Microthrixaceae bacterium]